MFRYLAVAVIGLLLPLLSSAQCLTTLTPNPVFVPPAPYPLSAPDGQFWYGTDMLWTTLNIDGKWHMQDNVLHGKGYRTKLVFSRLGFDWHKELQPKFIVTSKRLDAKAPLVPAEPANAVFLPCNAPAIMTAIDIPTAGCWELTARYNGQTLTFIVSVEP
jgi:hypothetical protein